LTPSEDVHTLENEGSPVILCQFVCVCQPNLRDDFAILIVLHAEKIGSNKKEISHAGVMQQRHFPQGNTQFGIEKCMAAETKRHTYKYTKACTWRLDTWMICMMDSISSSSKLQVLVNGVASRRRLSYLIPKYIVYYQPFL